MISKAKFDGLSKADQAALQAAAKESEIWLKPRYETHHHVRIQDGALVAAAQMSHRYISDRFLPDKAIDLVDEAASRIRMEIDSKPEVMDKLDRRLIQLKIEREAVKKGDVGHGKGLL